jgi:rare lipoprotein A (peptidoglycan hydrolase)
MITRARRAIPGMVVSVLLASPAWAAQTTTTTEPATAPEHRKAEATSEHRKPSPSQRMTPRSATRAARTAVAAPALVQPGSPIWSDSGEHATIWRQTGIASWYGGRRWQGHRTSSGSTYDQNALTAAHATLPIGTKVRVQLEGSDRAVIVTINDRPGTRHRIIDLSRSAAAELGILSRGVAIVTLTAL